MKSKLGLVLAILLFGGFFGTLFLLKGRVENKTEAEKFTLLKEEGEVYYKKSENDGYTEMVEEEMDLENGSFVKTGDGFGHIILPDNSMISLDADTEIQVKYENDKINVFQSAGNTWHRVQKLSDNGEYSVETANTLAAVRGTKFGVESNSGGNSGDLVFVVENSVEVSQVEKIDGKKNYLNKKILSENIIGEILPLAQREGFETMELLETQKNRLWFLRNRIIDKEFDGLRGEKLKQKILEKIMENTDLEIYRIKNRLESLREESYRLRGLRDQISILQNVDLKTVCENIDFQNLEKSLKILAEVYKWDSEQYAMITEIYKQLQDYCEDGELTANELGELQNLTKSETFDPVADDNTTTETTTQNTESEIPATSVGNIIFERIVLDPIIFEPINLDPVVLDPVKNSEFDAEMAIALEYYTFIDGNGAEICKIYSQTNPREIIADLISIENYYGVPNEVEKDFGSVICEVDYSCQNDQLIDKYEMDNINSLFPTN